METQKKATYKVTLGRKKKNGTVAVNIYVYRSATERKYYDTGINIKPSEFDSRTNRIRAGVPNQTELNERINAMIERYQRHELQHINSGKPFVLSMLDNAQKSDVQNSFNAFMQREIENARGKEESTKQSERTALRHLNSFNPCISMDEIKPQLIRDFMAHLYSKNLAANSVGKYLRKVKRFINIAKEHEIISEAVNPFRGVTIPSEDIELRYLKPDQFQRLQELDLSEKEHLHLQKTLDMYLFSCYSGLRYSDMQGLKHGDVVTDGNDTDIYYQQKKTKDANSVPISEMFEGKGLVILRKYMTEGASETAKIFPRMTGQALNRALKDIAVLANIENINLTYHTSRHTFGTELTTKQVPTSLIQNVMGHSKIESTLQYAKATKPAIKAAMKAVKW